MFSSLALALAISEPLPLKLDVVAASLFKNGYAVVVREADIPVSGDYVLRDVPRASQGTLWITSSPGTEVESVVSGTETKPTKTPVKDIEELVNQNVHKRVTLEFRDKASVTGKILSAPGGLVVIQTADRQETLPKSLIRDVVTPDSLVTSVAGVTSSRTLRFRVKAGRNARLRIMGLEAGLTWIPAYSFDISDKSELKLVAKATIVNDLDSIEGREISLTTGFPNMPYAGSLDPLVGDGASAPISRGITIVHADPVFSTQNAAPQMEQMPVATIPGMMTEDLFFYKLPNVTLGKGERSVFVIQKENAPYEHIYTWDVADEAGETRQTRAIQPTPKQSQEVWHSIKFTNKAEQPLTTGPGTVFKDGQIVGQGLLDYTSAGGKGILRITKAMDVSPDANEEEVSRERGALNVPRGAAYDLITVKGTLTVMNGKSEPIRHEDHEAADGRGDFLRR